MSNKIFEAFSVSHSAILDGTTGADLQDIYGVRSGGVELSTDSYDNTGDDAVLSTWYWFNFANVTISGGYVPFDLLSLLSGTAITSSGTAPNDYYAMQMWDSDALNQPARPLLVRCPSKDSNAVIRTLDFVLYKVFFEPFKFDGPHYKDGLLLNYAGRAVRSSLDEKGGSLSKPAIGRLVNRPPNTTGVFG